MARATAYCKCEKCGAEFEIEVYKPNRRTADSYAEWVSKTHTLCYDCEKAITEAKRKEENEAAAKKAEEAGLPKLIGSEKQIAWATTIRQELVDKVMNTERVHDGYDIDELKKNRELFMELINEGDLLTAKWWIDYRDYLNGSIYDRLRHKKAAAEKAAKEAAQEAAQEPAKEEKKEEEPEIVAPAEAKKNGMAEVKVVNGGVSAMYEKDDTFRSVVKALNFRWEGVWFLKTSELTGDPQNVAVELICKLLAKGFTVKVIAKDRAEIIRRVQAGEYTPMTTRWVISFDSKTFGIRWGAGEDLYSLARSLPGSSYSMGCVTVPLKNHQAVEDFAQAKGFKFTKEAQGMLDGIAQKTATIAQPVVKNAQYDEHPVADVLNSSREVLDDLKEDD